MAKSEVTTEEVASIGTAPAAPSAVFKENAEVMDLLETGLLADYGITHIDIAGHPEGNPDDPDPEQSLIAKLNWADTHGMHS
ncbi:MAG: hypothetical protein QF435_10590 [Arenicellales bacterium]|nr:hypothetical protein [Arenicellales bacterium]